MPHIDVAVKHSLGADKAFDRVMSWLGSQANDDPNVKPITTTIAHDTHRLDALLDAYGRRISVVLTASDDLVQVVSGNIPFSDIAGSAGIWWENRQLQSQLSTLLK